MGLKRFSEVIEIGCDEAGRGSLSGPVVAAAVVLPKNFYNSDLNDSKKISLKKRNELSKIIYEQSLACEIGIVDVEEIDKINILNIQPKLPTNIVPNIISLNVLLFEMFTKKVPTIGASAYHHAQ